MGKFLSLNGINIVVAITSLLTQYVIDLTNLKLFIINIIVSSKMRYSE